MNISIARKLDAEIEAAFKRLLPQLSSDAHVPDGVELKRIINSDCTTLFVARDENDTVIGTATLAIYRVPTGIKAWLEDVVVDSRFRNKGIGEALIKAALVQARHYGVNRLDLTSRPAREAANRLYKNLGFSLRDTNLYSIFL